MKRPFKHPVGLMVIVVYKALMGLLLLGVGTGLLLTVKNYDAFLELADSYTLKGKWNLIQWVLEKGMNISPRTLKFTGIAAEIYAVVTLIEAIGLWYEKAWAKVLVISLVAVSIIPEIWEIIRGITPIKVLIFAINLLILSYLIRHFRREQYQ